MSDQLLEGVLTEASLSTSAHDSITRAYPTLDDLLSATLEEIGGESGESEAARLWEVLERRWRSEAVGGDTGMTQVPSRLGRMVQAPAAGERPTSVRVQLRVLALLDVTMRAAGYDPDARTAE